MERSSVFFPQRKLEEVSQQRYHQAKQMEHKFQEQCRETSKGVQIISKFQSELAQWKNKVNSFLMLGTKNLLALFHLGTDSSDDRYRTRKIN